MRISDWSSDVCSSDLAQRGDGKHGVVGGLAVDGDAAVGVVLWARLRALVVAQHRDALCGEAARDVEEGLVRADALVAVVWTGAVHQHDRGHAGVNIGVLRHRKRAGQGAFAAADGEVGFDVGGIGVHGWRCGGRLRGGRGVQAGDLAVAVEGDQKQVGEGKGVFGRLASGGRRAYKKKKISNWYS